MTSFRCAFSEIQNGEARAVSSQNKTVRLFQRDAMEFIDLTESMRIGLDVSFNKIGYAVVNDDDRPIAWGVWTKPDNQSVYEWVEMIRGNLIDLKRTHLIYSATVVIEEPLKYHHRSNMPTMAKLNLIFGMVFKACRQIFNTIPLHPQPRTARAHLNLNRMPRESPKDVKCRCVLWVESRTGQSLEIFGRNKDDVADAFILALFVL